MANTAATVEAYLAALPEDRRGAIGAVRKVILKNMGRGFAEGMQYGMIGYFVPHSVFPAGYHCDPKQPLPFAGLSSQKGHMSLHMMGVYMSPELERWFRGAWAETGKKLDMGRACVRFKKLEDLALDVIGEAFRKMPAEDYVALYQSNLGAARKKPAKKKAAKRGGATLPK
jgi:hypothetical protein